MGTNNRQRRAEKKRRGRGGPPNTRSRPRPDQDSIERDISRVAETLIDEAAEMAAHNFQPLLEATMWKLVELPEHPCGGTIGGWVLSGCLDRALRVAWGRGWQPLDVIGAAAKRLGVEHVNLAVTAIASEARTSVGPGVVVPERWRQQLRDLGAVVWWDAGDRNYMDLWTDREGHGLLAALTHGVELLGMLIHLPAQPCLMPPPTQWGQPAGVLAAGSRTTGIDDRVLAKVRALLAKAESTTFDHEADALTAKAQELMARYAIDQAMLREPAGGDTPTGIRIWIDDPYAGAKSILLGAVARANRCRSVWSDNYGFASIFGFSIDLEIVEVLFTSLLVQATRAMTASGSVRDSSGRSRTRSFRQSFLIAFARRIGERLAAAADMATAEAGEVHGDGLLPVLAGRSAEVDDVVATAFPHTASHRLAVTNYEGWVAGRVAADLAVLGPEQELPPGATR